MKNILLFLLVLIQSSSAGFFETKETRADKVTKERAHYCQFFKSKAFDYKKNMRQDELAYLTLESYKKRAKIYCSDIPIKEDIPLVKELKKEKKIIKDISREDERLCKIFQNKFERYQKDIRADELAAITLESYRKRAYIFCSKETLEEKEEAVLNEDQKLCQVFQQGPKLCKTFEEKVIEGQSDYLVEETKKSFAKREKVFCSSKPLYEKDKKVYEENKQLCQLYYDNIETFKKNMKNNASAKSTLLALKKRVDYFCSSNE
jgi:hypothetical protein